MEPRDPAAVAACNGVKPRGGVPLAGPSACVPDFRKARTIASLPSRAAATNAASAIVPLPRLLFVVTLVFATPLPLLTLKGSAVKQALSAASSLIVVSLQAPDGDAVARKRRPCCARKAANS